MSEFFTLFMWIFMIIAFGFCAIVILVSMWNVKAKKALKPVQYLSYKKGHFYRDFTFTCEACGTRISSAQERCPSCGGVYGANKEYVKKKHAMNLKGMHAKCYIMQLEIMLLKATEMDLGTLWIANIWYVYKELTEYLETTQQLVGAIALGYADGIPVQPTRKKYNTVNTDCGILFKVTRHLLLS